MIQTRLRAGLALLCAALASGCGSDWTSGEDEDQVAPDDHGQMAMVSQAEVGGIHNMDDPEYWGYASIIYLEGLSNDGVLVLITVARNNGSQNECHHDAGTAIIYKDIGYILRLRGVLQQGPIRATVTHADENDVKFNYQPL